MQSLWLIIVVFFLLVLVIPIFAKVHLTYDIINNLGSFSIYIFFVKIFAFRIRIKGKNLMLISYDDEKEIETKMSEKKVRFFKQLNVQIKQKMVIRKINLNARVGVNDAALSAYCCGVFYAIVGIIFGYIKNFKKSARLRMQCEPDYNGTCAVFAFYFSFAITIFDVLYALIVSLIIFKRSEKYETL